jgi:3-oxoadipate enol-lactonase
MSTALLLHAGIADSRMWRPQDAALRTAGLQVIAPDLRGFGERRLEPAAFSYVRDAAMLLEGPAVVVGASLGGRVALELAVLRPELVERLVLIAPGLPGWQWAETTRAGWAEEEAALAAGDLEGAAEASLRLWVDGPRRDPEDVDPTMRAEVRAMLLRSYELQQSAWDAGAEEEATLIPAVNHRLDEVRCPTLVIVGDEDIPDMQAIAAHVTASIEGARLVTVPRASHLPSLERPEEVNAIVLEFLGEG